MDLLRFSTAGSVDDGKSTLIGRLLFDSKGVFEDQLEAAKRATRNESVGEVDLSLLTDGLRAEREQGITIDVAYRYFATPKRKFIIADTPGHEQYTRNMATGASTADASIILVDARNGVQVQSRRHTYIASLLGIRHLIVAVNKMDLVDYDQEIFESIKTEMRAFASELGVQDLTFIPVSALCGDNVVSISSNMRWYQGPALLSHLESLEVDKDDVSQAFRYPVQLVLRPDLDFRAFAGDVASGVVRKGDEIVVLPSGKRSRVRKIHTADGGLQEAQAPLSVALQLEDEIDVSRGDMLVGVGAEPQVARELDATLVWMDEKPMQIGRPYLIKHTTRSVRTRVSQLLYRTDVNSLEEQDADQLHLNEIGKVRLSCAEPLYFDAYKDNRRTGSFIIIDLESNNTVAAGMICEQQPAVSNSQFWSGIEVNRSAREALNHHKGAVLWLTGYPGTGKTAIARELERQLFQRGVNIYRLDGRDLRQGLSCDLGFDAASRCEHLRRAAEVAKILVDAGNLVVASFVSPLADHRSAAAKIVGAEDFLEIYVDSPAGSFTDKDPEGVYLRARAQEGDQTAEMDLPYEPAQNPQLQLSTHEHGLDEAVEEILDLLNERGLVSRAPDLQ